MKRQISALSFTVIFILICSSALAVTRYVPIDYPNIQAAIDDCNDGDVVIVEPNTYTGNGNRDIDFLGKAITVRNVDPNDPNIVAATIIDCGYASNGFFFHFNEDANSILSGLTIKKASQNSLLRKAVKENSLSCFYSEQHNTLSLIHNDNGKDVKRTLFPGGCSERIGLEFGIH